MHKYISGITKGYIRYSMEQLDTIPAPKKINSLHALMRLKPKENSKWCVFAYVLNRDFVKPDGTVDDLYAVIFPLGSFSCETSAINHAKNIMAITGHPSIVVGRYGSPNSLTLNPDPKVVTQVYVEDNKIKELETAQYKRDRDEHERKIKQAKEIALEEEQETDADNIEHFKREAILAIKNKAKYMHLAKQAEDALKAYEKRRDNIRDHYKRHPEHEEQWLPYLKSKLKDRGELELYNTCEKGYNEIKTELLNLPIVCEDGVCFVDKPVKVSLSNFVDEDSAEDSSEDN